jgi:hypothetical protein
MAALLHLATGTYGIAARHISGPAFYQNAGSKDDFRQRRAISEAKVLAISDPILPAADAPGWRVNELHRVVDQFYNQMKPLWITVNVREPGEMAERLSPQTYDRLRERAHLIDCFWPSFRQTVEPAACGPRLRKSS